MAYYNPKITKAKAATSGAITASGGTIGAMLALFIASLRDNGVVLWDESQDAAVVALMSTGFAAAASALRRGLSNYYKWGG